MNLHCRQHEVGPKKPRMRLWTDEMANYGSFEVVEFAELEQLHSLFVRLRLGELVVHEDECDGGNDCDCPRPTVSGLSNLIW